MKAVAACSTFLIAAQLGDLAWPVYTTSERSLRQAITPNHLLGRVNSSMHMLFHAVLPLGALAGGAIAQAVGMRGGIGPVTHECDAAPITSFGSGSSA